MLPFRIIIHQLNMKPEYGIFFVDSGNLNE